jgi:HD-GYP domain-containing protein (c-di-GMP phosphodiesterase class II)
MKPIRYKEDVYLPFSSNKLIVGRKVGFDVFQKKDITQQDYPDFVLFCAQGDSFTLDIAQQIRDNNIIHLYFRERDKDQVLEYLDWSPLESEENNLLFQLLTDKAKGIFDQDLKVVESFAQSIKEDGYVKFNIENLVAGWEVPFNVFLKTSNRENKRINYIICCHEGEVFNPSLLEKLLNHGIKQIYFHNSEQDKVLPYLHHNVKNILNDDNLPPVEKAERVYDVTYLWTRQFFTEETSRGGNQISLGIEFVDYLFECIRQNQTHQSWILELCRHDSTLYTHCINTCLLGIAFTKYLGLPDRQIRDFGLGALLHDIGMTKVPASILRQSGRLSNDEREMIKKHPLDGFRLLKTYSPLGRDSMIMVLQHHEHIDGSGYPEGLKLPMLSPFGRILRVIDSYEALTARRIWRQPLEPLKALLIMREEWHDKGVFDSNYLAEFIKFLSGK